MPDSCADPTLTAIDTYVNNIGRSRRIKLGIVIPAITGITAFWFLAYGASIGAFFGFAAFGMLAGLIPFTMYSLLMEFVVNPRISNDLETILLSIIFGTFVGTVFSFALSDAQGLMVGAVVGALTGYYLRTDYLACVKSRKLRLVRGVVNRYSAGMRFFVASLIGSSFLTLVLLVLHVSTNTWSGLLSALIFIWMFFSFPVLLLVFVTLVASPQLKAQHKFIYYGIPSVLPVILLTSVYIAVALG